MSTEWTLGRLWTARTVTSKIEKFIGRFLGAAVLAVLAVHEGLLPRLPTHLFFLHLTATTTRFGNGAAACREHAWALIAGGFARVLDVHGTVPSLRIHPVPNRRAT